MLSVQIDGGKENGIQNTILLIVAGSSSLYRGSELIESSLFTLPDSAFILYRYVEKKKMIVNFCLMRANDDMQVSHSSCPYNQMPASSETWHFDEATRYQAIHSLITSYVSLIIANI